MFSWKPIYEEIATKLPAYRDRQHELLAWLAEMKESGIPVIKLEDENPKGTSIPLVEIDPFSFFATFNRAIKSAHRVRCLEILKVKMSLSAPVPTDFDGIPVVNLQKAIFFPFAYDREAHMVPALWDLATEVVEKRPDDISHDLFSRCLAIPQVGMAKLTIGMFWLRPDQYLALDSLMTDYAKGRAVQVGKVTDYGSYRKVVTDIQAALGSNCAQISRDAYLYANKVPVTDEALDAGLKKLLETQATRSNLSVDELVQRLVGATPDGEDTEITNRLRVLPLIGSALAKPVVIDEYKKLLPGLWVFQNGQDSVRRNAFLDSEVAVDAMAELLDDESGIDDLSRIDSFIDIAIANGYSTPRGASDHAGAAQFASVLLSATRPDRFVDFRENRWNKLFSLMAGADKRLCSGSSYGWKLVRAGKFASALANTDTFRRLFGVEHGTWKVAGLAWVFRNGVFDMKIEKQKQYWAGGHLWNTDDGKGESHLDEFRDGNCWRHGYSREARKKAATETWRVFDQIRPGDEFAIKGYGGSNDLNVYYIGEVDRVDGDNAAVHLKPLGRSLFHGKAPSAGPGGSWFKTLTPVTNPDAIRTVFHGEVVSEPIPPAPCAPNTILYGPPGTGKTYRATHLAVEIIDGKLPAGGDPAIQARYRALVSEGRIDLVTFHQSFGYEEFVEGIRPTIEVAEEGERAVFDYRDGIFKRLAHRALAAASAPSPEQAAIDEYEARWKRLVSMIGDDPDREYAGLTAKTKYRLEVTARGNIRGHNTRNPDASVLLCSPGNLRKVYIRYHSRKAVTTSDVGDAVGVGSHTSLAAVIFRELQKVKIDQPSASREPDYADIKAANIEILGNADALMQRLRPAAEMPRYVLVVDEINRGNVSRILGELITLIEADKRIGGDHQLTVTLPYTNEPFGVPPNLFIVGTMNTADKSIALVDVALRRRFEFEECMPELTPDVCAGLNEPMRAVLHEMNIRITLRKDRDHQIGHSYFIKVHSEDAFNDVVRRSVLPLLQEYFYNDWDGLRFVLGETKDQGGAFIEPLPKREPNRARNRWQWKPEIWTAGFPFLSALGKNYWPKEAEAYS